MDGTMRSQGRPHRSLWNACWCAIQPLCTAFSYHATFMWFATIVVGMMVRPELRGVTSIVRALNLRPDRYNPLRRCFHSTAIKLDQLTALWVQGVAALHKSDAPQRPAGPGRGWRQGRQTRQKDARRQAPASAIQLQHQARIHHGTFHAGRGPARQRGLERLRRPARHPHSRRPAVVQSRQAHAARQNAGLDQVLEGSRALLLCGRYLLRRRQGGERIAQTGQPSGVTRQIQRRRLVSPEPQSRPGRGRPKLYGRKIRIKSLASDVGAMDVAVSPVYGERGVKIRYRVCDLMWRPVGRLVRFVAVVHPTRGTIVLMTTDLSLEAMDIIRIYGLRFKIELTFKQAAHQIGLFAYHFWMMEMMPLRYRNGNQYLHRATDKYRDQVRRKIRAYHVFMQAGAIAHGLLQYLASEFTEQVWASFGSWLRTIRPGVPPSEFVVENVMRQTLRDFLVNGVKTSSLAKFIAEQQDADDPKIFRLAS